MIIEIQDYQEIEFSKLNTEDIEIIIKAYVKQINIMSTYIDQQNSQIVTADGYKIKVIDLRN